MDLNTGKLNAEITWDIVITADKFSTIDSVWKKPAPGVYGIKHKNEWQYIGRSVNSIYIRILKHLSNMFIFKNADLSEFELYFKMCEHPILEELKYIYFLRPILNSEVRKSFDLEPINQALLHGETPPELEPNREAMRRLVSLL